MSQEKWHALEEQDVYEELQTGPKGLGEQEVVRRLKYCGPNTLPTKEPPTIWAILLHQVLNPLIFILLAATVASVAVGEAADAAFILIIIALNSGLGAYQEYQAEKSATSLQRLLKIKARVRRGGKEMDIPLMPGLVAESGHQQRRYRGQ